MCVHPVHIHMQGTSRCVCTLRVYRIRCVRPRLLLAQKWLILLQYFTFIPLYCVCCPTSGTNLPTWGELVGFHPTVFLQCVSLKGFLVSYWSAYNLFYLFLQSSLAVPTSYFFSYFSVPSRCLLLLFPICICSSCFSLFLAPPVRF